MQFQPVIGRFTCRSGASLNIGVGTIGSISFCTFTVGPPKSIDICTEVLFILYTSKPTLREGVLFFLIFSSPKVGLTAEEAVVVLRSTVFRLPLVGDNAAFGVGDL